MLELSSADAILVDLSRASAQRGQNLILLGEHVDYWNYIGWTDRFSSAQFSQRQNDYARTLHLESVYTPQMVIDGRVQFVGNDASEVHRKIDEAAKEPMPAQVLLQWENPGRLHVTVQSHAASQAKVLLGITEDGLSTTVGRGTRNAARSGDLFSHLSVGIVESLAQRINSMFNCRWQAAKGGMGSV